MDLPATEIDLLVKLAEEALLDVQGVAVFVEDVGGWIVIEHIDRPPQSAHLIRIKMKYGDPAGAFVYFPATALKAVKTFEAFE